MNLVLVIATFLMTFPPVAGSSQPIEPVKTTIKDIVFAPCEWNNRNVTVEGWLLWDEYHSTLYPYPDETNRGEFGDIALHLLTKSFPELTTDYQNKKVKISGRVDTRCYKPSGVTSYNEDTEAITITMGTGACHYFDLITLRDVHIIEQ